MPSAADDDGSGVRRRPKNRKALIAQASADAFSAQGYHAVSMGDIASRVGVSPAALYRHSHSKYDLFRDAVLALGQVLVDATAFADESDDNAEAQATLTALITALVDATITQRTAGGLYRWEGRYLRDADQATLTEQLRLVNRRLQRPLVALRPELESHQRWTLSSAALSVIGSIADHFAPLAAADIRDCLSGMVSDVLAAELPPLRQEESTDSAPRITFEAGAYEFVLHESIRMFHELGFRDTGMEDIAAAVGMQPSGIYRHFPGKADILAAALRRAADGRSRDLHLTARAASPGQALDSLMDAYIDRFHNNPMLAYIYYTERNNVPESESRVIDRIEQSTVDAWARLVTETRPELGLGKARYGVYAAFVLIADLGRLTGSADNAQSRAMVRRLMETILRGRPPERGCQA